jgi:NAD(P)-dependent dehydrogenase (short-subunit alcohol dehydrogenase family)
MNTLDDRVAIVTGATVGIGAATTRRLVGLGASVVAMARDRARGKRLADEFDGRVRFLPGSVTDREAVKGCVELARRLGGPHILVNNAGVDYNDDLLEATEEDVRRVFETNVFGALWMLQEAAAVMARAGSGSIVNVSSRLASVAIPKASIYSASKGALLALTRGAAIDLAPLGVRVNAVAPGLIATQMVEDWLDAQPDREEFRSRTTSAIPQGRLGTVDEVAELICFLASDHSSHITGASIPVDGGYTAT